MNASDLVFNEMPIVRRIDLLRLWIRTRHEVEVDRLTCYRIYRELRDDHFRCDYTDLVLKNRMIDRGILRAMAHELIDDEIKLQRIARSKLFRTSLRIRPVDRVARRVTLRARIDLT